MPAAHNSYHMECEIWITKRSKVRVTCRLSLNFRKVGWPGVITALVVDTRQSDQRGLGSKQTVTIHSVRTVTAGLNTL